MPVADIAVSLQDVRERFGQTTVVDGIELEVAKGEFLTLLGPSGCGKTTSLNMIAGFLQPDGGVVRLAGKDVQGLPPFRRDIGLVFQDYALFPHMTVNQNVAFGLRMRKVGRAEIAARVAAALDLVKLTGLGERRPMAMSGGQRQRVALARALVIDPTVLLLDEPLSNLDLKLRESMRLEITEVQRRTGVTTILVTHDQSEALVMSDRIAVMNRGRIEQIGVPREIYARPATRFVAEFIGSMNLVPCVAGGDGTVKLGGQVLRIAMPQELVGGAPALVAFRPEKSALAGPPDGLRQPCVVVQHVYLGTHTQAHVRLADGTICIADMPGELPAIGALATLCLPASECIAYPA